VTRYILSRLASLPLTLSVVLVLTFSIVHLVPGDAVDVLGGENLTEQDRLRLRQQYGLDQTLPVQFVRWLGNALHGDLGTSIRTNRPVFDEVLARLGATVELALLSILIALAFGIIGGAVATRWRGSWLDKAIMSASIFGMSVPNYFAATTFILLVSLYIPAFGVVSYVPFGVDPVRNLKSLLFPALSLGLLAGASFCRYFRTAAEDIVRSADFVRTAKAKGASEWRTLLHHILPNSLVPLVTVAGLQFAYLIGGTVVIETIYAIPGIGQLMIASIGQRDYLVVQGCVLLQTVNFVVINLLVDLLYPVLDPRVRITGAGR
jgi:peptide/nickel transport system permease protein